MNAPSYGKTRKDNATSRIIVGQKEGRKEPSSYMRATAIKPAVLNPVRTWIDCPKDKAEVKEIANRGRVTARQLAKTLKAVLDYVVTEVVDCGGARCNEPCCLTCFGEEKAEKEAARQAKLSADALAAKEKKEREAANAERLMTYFAEGSFGNVVVVAAPRNGCPPAVVPASHWCQPHTAAATKRNCSPASP